MSHKTTLRKLLEIEQNNFAIKLNLISGSEKKIPCDLCLESLNALKDISNQEESDFNRQLAIMIVALLWTHCSPEIKDNLRQIMTPILSTLGFSPSNLMLDDNLRDEGIYSPIGSYFDKLRIITSDLKNQITIKGKEYTLTSFQADLWKAIETSKLLGISAPTSAGKSFLLYLKILDMISKGATKFVYVVPTLSLISQVTSDLSNLLRQHKISEIEILNSYERELEKFIYVVTQERAISIFSEEGLREIDLLVVDEIQNIEKVANDGEDRSKILYDVLIDVRNDIDVGKVLLSGPRLKNIGNLGFEIFGELSTERKTDSPPVLSLTYSISKQKSKFYLNQYSPVFDVPRQITIANHAHIQGIGGVQYNEKFNNYLHATLLCLKDEVNVVFSPTSNQARKSARAYSSIIKRTKNETLYSLANYFRESVHPQYELAKIVELGVAYHTGKTPMHVRRSIESATSKKLLNTLFCTTTLMQGVNLPAKNVIIRNPNLFTKRRSSSIELSAYEFANLRGRAGRLLTDFIGRTVVLDESAFSNTSQGDQDNLFPDEYKEIKTGYKSTYEQHSEFIDDALSENRLVDESPAKSLLTYVRQVLYRHQKSGVSRLKDVGLSIDENLLKETISSFNSLKVPKDVVLSNRYWDPFDLNTLYAIYQDKKLKLPTSVFSSGLYFDLLNCMKEMHNFMPYYFSRYLGSVSDETYMYGIAKSAESWAREKPLNSILMDRFGSNDPDIDNKIDAEIEKLGKYVSFGLPMLLKPISDMGNNDSNIISSIELGVYLPATKFLVDRGIPRETAIKITQLHKDKRKNDLISNLDKNLIKRKLNNWEYEQAAQLL